MLRERSVRKAKDRANEHLHEISTNKSLHNTTNNNNNNNNKTLETTTPKCNVKSKQRINNTNEHGLDDDDDEQSQAKINRTKQRSTAKKPAVTKRTNNQAHQHVIIESNSRQSNETNNDNDNQLYNQLFTLTNASIQTITDNWIDAYKKNKDNALIALINFIIRSTGCKGGKLNANTSKTLFKTKEYQSIISDLIDYMDDGEYPMQQHATQQQKKFKQNFIDFIQNLIQTCQYSIIYDQFLCDNLITFLISMSDSQVRAFRHTATLVLMKLMTNFIDVQVAVQQNACALRKQYDNEKQKSQQKRAVDRLDILQAKCNEYAENNDELQNFLDFIFKACFIHRYRDICADIRSICIQELGEWMRKCPTKYLDDTYLKYIGWTLYDKSSECRLKCIQALQPLYANEQQQQQQDDHGTNRMELFTSRFKTRLLEMSLDKDIDVSCHTIRLLTEIIKTNMESVNDADCEAIYELVFHISRPIAQAAGEFLYEKLFDKIESIQFDSSNKSVVQLIIQFLIESELHEHPAYLVDSLWNVSVARNNMLKDWKSMCDILLTDAFCLDNTNADICEQYMIELIHCCVKQACTGQVPIARQTGSTSHLTQKELKQIDDDKLDMTQCFIPIINKLVEKYIADAEKLQHLLQIPLYFDLTQYTLRRQEKNVDNFLQQLNDIILNRHTDKLVLETAAEVYAYYCGEQDDDDCNNGLNSTMANSITIKCSMKRGILMDTLYQQLNTIYDQFKDRDEAIDHSELYPLIVILKRFAIFSQYHDVGKYTNELWSIVNVLLKSAISNDAIDVDLVRNCFNLARSLLCWNLKQLKNTSNNNGTFNQTESMSSSFELVKRLSKKYYKLLNRLIVHNSSQIEMEAYLEICDILVLFNKHLCTEFFDYDLADTGFDVNELVIECQANDVNMLALYCNNNVFDVQYINERLDTVEKIQQLHQRRAILSAFCKLITYNSVPIRYMADICRGYVKFLTSYGDIIKHTINQGKERNKVHTIRAISLTLQREFNELILNQANESTDRDLSKDNVITSTQDYHQVKELAKKFLFLFSANDATTHDALVEFQKDGINYVNDALNKDASGKWQTLAFFDLLSDVYANKLNTNDKRLLIKYLNEKALSKHANKNLDIWQPYFNYRDSLIHVNENAQQKVLQQQQQQQQGDENGIVGDDDDDDETVAQPQTTETKQTETPFQLTSTVLQSTRIDSNAKIVTRKRTSLFTSNMSNILTRKRKQDSTLNISDITLLPMDNVAANDGPNSKIEIISRKTTSKLAENNFTKVPLKRSRSPLDENTIDESNEDNENSHSKTLINDDTAAVQIKRTKLSQTPKKVSIAD